MKTHNSTRAWMATAIIVGATALTSLTSSPLTAQTPSGQQGAPAGASTTIPQSDQQLREAWRAEMARRPTPKTGCFNAAYPSTEWQEVPCGRPSQSPNQRGAGPNLVGNGADYAAKTSGLISSATGSFLPGSNASGVSGPVGGTVTNNVFMFQINTQSNFLSDGSTFSTPACGGIAGCYGWQQFLFSQTQGPAPGPGQSSVAPGTTPGVFIEYWLFNYGAACPILPSWAVPPGSPATTPWNSDGAGDCWFNGPVTYVPPQTAATLPTLVMTATTSATQDTVVLATPSNMYVYSEPNVLSLSLVWTEAEFNVFGDCCLTQTSFTTPTVLLVKNSINDGTTNPPTCVPNDGTTGETNNLNFEPTAGPVCCPYGGASPAIEFDEADSGAGHTASCGPTKVEGDPHLTTADGTHYDFQAAGEFVTLRDPDGMEIQTRQTPIATTFFPGPNPYDGLATCVSINTAVAARVGRHRVTWEPNLSGVPDPSGLQLRIDGVLTALRPPGVALGPGARVAPAAGGALQVDFPDGKTLLVTPEWWANQSKWFLNVDISNLGLVSSAGVPAGRGIAGAIAAGSWLPALPDGSSMGPIPASLPARYDALYGKFADAWRVNDKDSLFDYAPGTSTNTYTMRDWPKQTPPCVVPNEKPVEPATDRVAQAVCRRVADLNRRADCTFDVMATGNVGFATAYLKTQRILAYSTTTNLTGGEDPSQPGEWVTFTALVAPQSSPAPGVPSGTVEFTVDGTTVPQPRTIDAKGRATWETSRLKVGEHRVTATYVPGAESAFLPSTSPEKLHLVQRCPCGTPPK
jgi:Bacterial Ig-like domain (group 3)